jgi:short chain dehydrogenase
MKLANKVALITGGNSGIGFATARLFVAEGARVAITGRNPKTLQAAAKELGQNVLALPADVTDIAATERVVDTLTKQWGKLDILFDWPCSVRTRLEMVHSRRIENRRYPLPGRTCRPWSADGLPQRCKADENICSRGQRRHWQAADHGFGQSRAPGNRHDPFGICGTEVNRDRSCRRTG